MRQICNLGLANCPEAAVMYLIGHCCIRLYLAISILFFPGKNLFYTCTNAAEGELIIKYLTNLLVNFRRNFMIYYVRSSTFISWGIYYELYLFLFFSVSCFLYLYKDIRLLLIQLSKICILSHLGTWKFRS